MDEKLSDIHLSAWRNMITFHARVIDAIDHALSAADCIPLHWYDVLIELYEAPNRQLRMHELADRVVLSRSGLTRLIDRLEDAALITREIDAQDRRGFYAKLTRNGVQALGKAWPIYAAAIERHFANYLSDEEAKAMADRFNQMLEGWGH